ncbi:MAG: tetratricopeptide repeat protein [Candidatus Omnitrophica bacterium]|nr:tetratricopeptide repeat protein [Candidatus Omnitrophota bacterium]
MRKIIFATVAVFLIIVSAVSAEEKALDPNKLFYSANSLYEKRDYEKSLEEYSRILDMGKTSGPLYYNMGNCYFKMGKLGYAILFYEKARRVMPQDGDLKANLDYAVSLIGGSTVDTPRKNPVVSIIKAPFKDFSLNAIAVSVVFLYFVFAILLAIGIVTPVAAKKIRAMYPVALSLLIISIGAFAIRYYDEEILRRGIVVNKGVEAKYEPIDKSTIFYRLQEGDEVSVIKTRDGWRQIRRIDGRVGWVPKTTIEEI